MANQINEIRKVLKAIKEDPQTPWEPTSIVEVPGAYNIYACGTSGDVTILAWIHPDGRVIIRHQFW